MCGYMVWDCGKLAGLKINALLFKEELQENINLGARLIEDFSAFSIVPYPVSTVVAMYVLTGCEYVSMTSSLCVGCACSAARARAV